MTWLLAALDLAAGVYLLRWALPRQRRDRDAVLAVGVILLLCAVTLVGVGAYRAAVGCLERPRRLCRERPSCPS